MRLRLPLVAAILLHAPAARAADDADAPLAIVAGGGVVAVVGRDGVQLLDEAGRPLGRLGAGVTVSGPGLDTGARRERVLDRLDVPEEERDTQVAEDLVEDELTLGERRAQAAGRQRDGADDPSTALAAASARGVFVVAGRALWLAQAGRRPQRLAPLRGELRALAASADGRAVVIAEGHALLGSSDGGLSFAPLGVAARAERLALAGGALAWTEGAHVIIARPGAPPTTVPLGSPVRDVAACADTLIALAEDGLWSLAPEPVRLGGPVAAARLACPAEGTGPWLAVGPALLETPDRGRTWEPRLDAPASPLVGAALTRDYLWLVGRDGLSTLPRIPGGRAARPRVAAAPAARRVREPRWAGLLPRLTLDASYVASDGNRELRAFALADFALGPRPPVLLAFADPASDPSSEPARERRRAPGPDPDAACLEEARARAVELALVEPGRARSFVARAGQAAWLPELRLRAEQVRRRNESLTSAAAAADSPLGVATTNELRYEARATWDLGRLVFSPDEIAAEYQALRMTDMRREIESQLHRLYFERRRLLADRPPVDDVQRAVRLEEVTAELDALSAGAFSACRRPYHEAP
jgi:hypothetical protein